jgi:hypothetical protein
MIRLFFNKFFKNSKQARFLQTWLANRWFLLKSKKKNHGNTLQRQQFFSNFLHDSFHQKDFFSIQSSSLFAINYWINFHLNEKLIRPIFQFFRHQLRQKSFTHKKLPLMRSAVWSPFQAYQEYKKKWLSRKKFLGKILFKGFLRHGVF